MIAPLLCQQRLMLFGDSNSRQTDEDGPLVGHSGSSRSHDIRRKAHVIPFFDEAITIPTVTNKDKENISKWCSRKSVAASYDNEKELLSHIIVHPSFTRLASGDYRQIDSDIHQHPPVLLQLSSTKQLYNPRCDAKASHSIPCFPDVSQFHQSIPRLINRRITSISFGMAFAVFSDDANELWSFGRVHSEINSTMLHSLGVPSRAVTSIAAGDSHCLVSTTEQLLVVGSSDMGALGCGEKIRSTAIPLPVKLSDQEEYPISIAAASHYSIVVTGPSGYVYTFGSGAYCRLGHPPTGDVAAIEGSNVWTPARVMALEGVGQLRPDGKTSGVKQCSCGPWHSVVVSDTTNDIFGWGWNKFKQLGSCNEEMLSTPERISELDCDGLLGSEYEIKTVTCGARHTAILTTSGRVIVLGMLGVENYLELSFGSERNNSLDCEPRVLNIQPLAALAAAASPALAVDISSYRWGVAVLVHS